MNIKNPDEHMDLTRLNISGLKLPRWVSWLTQDADGQWWGYEVEPHQYHQGWYENELGRNICMNKITPSQNWKDSLQKCNKIK